MARRYWAAELQCRTIIGIRCKDGIVLVSYCNDLLYSLYESWTGKQREMRTKMRRCLEAVHADYAGHREARSFKNAGERLKSFSLCCRQACWYGKPSTTCRSCQTEICDFQKGSLWLDICLATSCFQYSQQSHVATYEPTTASFKAKFAVYICRMILPWSEVVYKCFRRESVTYSLE